MKLSAALAGVVLLLGAGQAAGAAHCEDSRQMSSPDAVIAACTSEIQKNLGPSIDIAADYVIRSHALTQKGDKARAIEDLNQAVEVSPYYWEALVNRAVYYTNSGELDLALKDYNDAILFHADIPEAYLYRAVVYDKKGDLDRAIADAAEAIRRNPKYVQARLFLMDRYVSAGRPGDSIAEASAALALGAKPDRVFNSRCWARAVAGLEPRLALADCNQALTLAPGNPSYLDSRGLVDLRLGDFDGAIKDYSTALAAMPSLAASLYGRSIARRRKGDVAGADADASAATAMDNSVAAQFDRWGLRP